MLHRTHQPPLRTTPMTCCSVALACSLDPLCPRLPSWSMSLILVLYPCPRSLSLILNLQPCSMLGHITATTCSGFHRVVEGCQAGRSDCLEHCWRLRRLQWLLHRLQQDLPAADQGGQVGRGAAREEARQHALWRRWLHLCHEKTVEHFWPTYIAWTTCSLMTLATSISWESYKDQNIHLQSTA